MKRHSKRKCKNGWIADRGDCYMFTDNEVVAEVYRDRNSVWRARAYVPQYCGYITRKNFTRRCDAKRWCEETLSLDAIKRKGTA